MNTLPQLFDTAGAAAYLTSRGGIRVAAGTLRNLRAKGGGPKYRWLGRRPIYTAENLDLYLESKLREYSPVAGRKDAQIHTI